ncbi:DUF262 domain-containing protein [Rhodococcus sp. IEGM 1370]|uniref:GmrSD restriction endonuclease domain-containing protein n=1 Tax=Rhodococcus sp. IEGM 1370 TaxID=3082222 RepID=UPI00295596C5|nr:DUF262 domain-containing protein [Rhodococcus sp. IEGM 1370]MDV8079457.1 DUF262 domain-containing protein [Rhodococcus sp. IEGM 1370]
MADLPIRRILTDIAAGSIRIPAFQRGFVWDAEHVAYLMDSIYKNYPFGAVILWRTKEKLNSERNLGPFTLPEAREDYPVHYVLDGQQRLTSIFGVFQTELVPDGEHAWTNIFFDMEAKDDVQESQFFALDADSYDPKRYFPISSFFDVTEFRNATKELNDDQVRLIDSVQSVFKEAAIPTQEIATDDRSKVAIVFERVNRLGVELDVFQLLTAWTWSEDFDLQEKFASLSEELRPFGFADVGEDNNLLLRCCSAIVAGDASPNAFVNLRGVDVRDKFDDIAHGIKGAIDFLRTEFSIETLANLPYPASLVPLAVFFAKDTRKISNDERHTLTLWFWRSAFTRRYSAGVVRNLNRDILEAAALREKKRQTTLATGVSASIERDFFTKPFNVSTVNTKTFLAMLVQAEPKSFVSGQKVSLAKVLQQYNRNEFHHLMPRAYAKTMGIENDRVNGLANFAIISAADNKVLGGVAPSKYKEKMPAKETDAILTHALCPQSLFLDDFDTFIGERIDKLNAAAFDLMNTGKIE